MRFINIAIVICIFLLLRPYQLQNTGLSYRGDDLSYFAHATAIAYGEFPAYDKEYFEHGTDQPMHSIGPGLMAAPFVLVFSFIDRLTDADIVERRTESNIVHSWSMFGFVVASSVYFWAGCWMLYVVTRRYFSERHTVWAILLMVLVQGIPIYVFRRPIFSHAYEFFLQAAMIYLYFKPIVDQKFGLGYWIRVGTVLGLMPLVRYNNLVAAVFWWMIMYMRHCRGLRPVSRRNVWGALAVCLTLIGGFYVWPHLHQLSGGYQGKLAYFFKPWWLLEYPYRFVYVLVNQGWGLIFTAPFILVGLWRWCFSPQLEKSTLWWAMIPMAVNFHLIVTSDGQGGYYGYRYFICSMIPLLVLPLAGWLRDMEQRFGRKFYAGIITLAIWPLLSMISFQGNNSSLTLDVVQLHKGWGFSNPTYQWEIWKLLLTKPVDWLVAVLKGGLLYLVYLTAHLTQLQQLLPDIVTRKYPVFRWDVLIKVVVLWMIPVCLNLMFTPEQEGKSSRQKHKP